MIPKIEPWLSRSTRSVMRKSIGPVTKQAPASTLSAHVLTSWPKSTRMPAMNSRICLFDSANRIRAIGCSDINKGTRSGAIEQDIA